jgi:hypothetical protein
MRGCWRFLAGWRELRAEGSDAYHGAHGISPGPPVLKHALPRDVKAHRLLLPASDYGLTPKADMIRTTAKSMSKPPQMSRAPFAAPVPMISSIPSKESGT